MFEVYLDGRILDFAGDETNCIISPKLSLALNEAGTFKFDITYKNPEYGNIENRASMIQVLKNGKEVFNGEVKYYDKESDNVKSIYTEGELSFLQDSIQPQAEYHNLTTRQILETWLNIHNSQVEERKRFYVGIVTIHDSNDSLYRYTNRENTLEAICEKLIDRLGGYLRIRKVNGVRYLDWITLAEYGKYCEQPIEFGTNLLDYAENTSASDLATAVLPLGARLEESPIEGLEAYTDITSVNNGVDYLYIPEAVNRFGWIKKVVSWDDVTQPSNLKNKGLKWLQDNQYESVTLELTAVDLANLDVDYESFELGDMVHAVADVYGMDRSFPIRQMEIYLHEPDQNKLTLGTTVKKTFTKQMAKSKLQIHTQLENVRQTTSWMQSAIDNATAMMTGSKGGYKVSEYDENGRWIRDLYMNAPRKEDATLVMQINMNGIGFSRDGFNGPYKNAWTIDGVLLGEFIKAGSVTAEKLSVEYRQSVMDEIVTKFNVAAGKIEAEVTRATGQEIELAAAIKVTADQIESKVSKDGFGSYVQQYWDSVIYGFNFDSKYVQINPGEIAIYDNGVEESKKRSVFDQNGLHFYRDGYYVGKIGTNYHQADKSKKGLNFDLEYNAAYMAWAARKKENDDAYTIKWSYFHKDFNGRTGNTLYAGCAIDMDKNPLQNIALKNVFVYESKDTVYSTWNGSITIGDTTIEVKEGVIIGVF